MFNVSICWYVLIIFLRISIINLDNMFAESFTPTIGIDFKIKTLRVRDKSVKLQLWDTAGQEKFFNITRSYYVSGIHSIDCDLFIVG